MARQNIAYESDIRNSATVPEGAVEGNIPAFGVGNALVDSGRKASDLAGKAELASKADKATTLEGYGITDAATKTELASKADKATTLEGYGITDGATKAELLLKADITSVYTRPQADEKLAAKADESALSALAGRVDDIEDLGGKYLRKDLTGRQTVSGGVEFENAVSCNDEISTASAYVAHSLGLARWDVLYSRNDYGQEESIVDLVNRKIDSAIGPLNAALEGVA